jgi:hypothetical protein
LGWLRFGGWGVLRHAIERLSHRQNVTIGWFADVSASLHPNVLHAAQDWMLFHGIHDGDACALRVIFAIMTNPSLSEHLMAEAELVIAAFVVIRILRIGRVLWNLEAMRGCAHADHGAAAIQIGIKMFHLLRREVLEAQEHHCEIRRVQRLDPRHV